MVPPQAQPNWRVAQPSCLGFHAQSSPLPSFERPGVRWPLAEDGGVWILLALQGGTQSASWLLAIVLPAAWEV